MTYRERITTNPDVMVGKAVIKGTRIPVEVVLKKLAQDVDVKQILKEYPRLTVDDVKAAILYAESLVEETEEYAIGAT